MSLLIRLPRRAVTSRVLDAGSQVRTQISDVSNTRHWVTVGTQLDFPFLEGGECLLLAFTVLRPRFPGYSLRVLEVFETSDTPILQLGRQRRDDETLGPDDLFGQSVGLEPNSLTYSPCLSNNIPTHTRAHTQTSQVVWDGCVVPVVPAYLATEPCVTTVKYLVEKL